MRQDTDHKPMVKQYVQSNLLLLFLSQGKGKTKYGPGVDVILTGDEVATAIDSYLVLLLIIFMLMVLER